MNVEIRVRTEVAELHGNQTGILEGATVHRSA
jgi:hypothetical protein